MSSKITIELSKAKTLQEIERLINICDRLHKGEKVTGYNIKDLPSDSVYAEYRNKLNLTSNEPIQNNNSKELIIQKLINRFSLTFEDAEKYFIQFSIE